MLLAFGVDGDCHDAFNVLRTTLTKTGKADHGLVVDALEAAVKHAGQRGYNDGARDLFVLDERKRMSVLFEVKTDVTTTSIYTAVGQLLLNGGGGSRAPRKVPGIAGQAKTENFRGTEVYRSRSA